MSKNEPIAFGLSYDDYLLSIIVNIAKSTSENRHSFEGVSDSLV